MTFSVLILDDEPWQLSWVEDVVRPHGTCDFATTYDEAKERLLASRPAIVIVDIRIGEVSEPLVGATLLGSDPAWVGLRFVRYVRVEAKMVSTPLFVYTALDRDDLQRTVEDTYSARFFTKFEAARFRTALSQTVAKLAQ